MTVGQLCAKELREMCADSDIEIKYAVAHGKGPVYDGYLALMMVEEDLAWAFNEAVMYAIPYSDYSARVRIY